MIMSNVHVAEQETGITSPLATDVMTGGDHTLATAAARADRLWQPRAPRLTRAGG
jgi:hypothetical protein